MSLAVWSWITAAVSLFGAFISSRSPRRGWMYGIGAQLVWITAAVATHQPGTVALSSAFIVIDCYSLWRWRGTRFTPAHHFGPLHRWGRSR